MTDGQPGQSNDAANAAGTNAGQDTGFNVTFDEGAGGNGQGTDNGAGADNANLAGDNNAGGTDNPDAGAADEFAWVPEDYREEFKNDETLKQYTSQDAFVKAMLDDRKANGTAIKLPAADATEEEWGKFYDKLGRPETPEAYGLSKELPEGLDFSEELYDGFIQNIHKAGLTKKQADALYTWYNNKSAEMSKDITAKIEASYKKSVDDAVVSLKKEWGTDYQKNLDSAVAMANKFLSPATKQYLNATKLGNNPLLIKDFYNLSKQVSGAQMRGDGPSGNVSSLAELEAKMAANLRAADYTTNVKLQQENKEIANKIAQLQSRG